ncbi:hypothetical protein QAD02_017723 [Eretmocerus hayati]|uniref:Uncharacterized protein n=1 Tax=Eretmocerus hayati TaxID=131215 RepID=A0ACC2PFX9_9HYME|nr:hypothetical protein QAD02_017723 [Eretmocerus hayati]
MWNFSPNSTNSNFKKIFFFRRNLRDKLDRKFDFNLGKIAGTYQQEQQGCTKVFIVNNSRNSIHSGETIGLSTHTHGLDQNSQNFSKPEENIVNLTDIHIPEQVIKILNLGDRYNHALKPNQRDILNILKNVENTINPFSFSQQKEFTEREMNTIRNKILKHINNYNPKKIPISEYEHDVEYNVRCTRKFMKENGDILITKSDKGNKTVLIYREIYIQKMKENLEDELHYEKVNSNPLNKVINRVKDFIKKVNPKHPKNMSMREKMLNNKININVDITNLSRAYGLPKTHKENNPLRIIVSSINSPLSELSKSLGASISRGCAKMEFQVKDSWTLKDDLQDITIPSDHILISFDAVQLFTKISLMLIVKAVEKRWQSLEDQTPLTKNEFLEAVKLIFNNTYFQFEGEFYRQKDGAPMGLPLSPIVANLVMEDCIEECLEKLNNLFDFKPRLLKIFVDDGLAIIPKDQVANFMNTFNNYDNNLKFTIELEKNSQLPFLDLLLINHNGNLITDWYQKPTQSHTYLNFNSHNPSTQKMATIYNLVDRGIKLAHPQYHSKNLKKIRDLLLLNGYPLKFIARHINTRITKIRNSDPQQEKALRKARNELYKRETKVVIPLFQKTF